MRTLTAGRPASVRGSGAPTARHRSIYANGPAVLVPKMLRYPSADAALAGLAEQWGRLLDLTQAWNALEAKRVRLEAKLCDPALADHPKRPEAVARWDGLWRERGELLARIGAQAVVVSRIWAALPPDAQARWPERWPRTENVWAARDAIERRLGLLTRFDMCPF